METLYEHAGGDDGLHRLEELFYAKALADPVLKTLFTTRVPTHVDHLTWFTAESFGGPDRFSRELGFQYIIDVHRHLNITDEQRDRFVAAYLEALDEAGCRTTSRSARRSASTSSSAPGWRSRTRARRPTTSCIPSARSRSGTGGRPGPSRPDLGAVGVEGDVAGDLRHRRVRVLVGPDDVGLGRAVRRLDAVVARVALVGAVGLGGAAVEQRLVDVLERDVLGDRVGRLGQRERLVGLGDGDAADAHGHPGAGGADRDRVVASGILTVRFMRKPLRRSLCTWVTPRRPLPFRISAAPGPCIRQIGLF